MSGPAYDRSYWEELWAKTLREQPEKVAGRPPNGHLVGEANELAPGRALDAGCGHGAEALWLAARGWTVTAVDVSASALADGAARAVRAGTEVAGRIDWVEGDLATWAVPVGRFDLVCSLYVHVAGSVEEFVQRLASGVAPGGTLLLVGHRPVDPVTGAPSLAAGQVQVTTETAVPALGSGWQVLVAEDRPRPGGSGVDAVVRALRQP